MTASPPLAEYHLTAWPEWLEVRMPPGRRVVLVPGRPHVVARVPSEDVFVPGSTRLFNLGWGGMRNHGVEAVEGQWRVSHYGHHGTIWLNGAPFWRHHVLEDGDRVEPAQGLVFTFRLRADLERLRDELAQAPPLPSDDPVLLDWVMERTGFDRAQAELAFLHLAARSAGRP